VTPDAAQLLRSLAAGVHQARAGEASRTSPISQVLGAGADFASILQQARAGEIPSGREIRVPPGSGLELSGDQLARLQTAADKAEAHGASQALFALDGVLLRMDIPTRTITAVVDPSTSPVIDGIDAFVGVAKDGAGAQQPSIIPITGELAALPLNTSLLSILARRAS
jgi:hypothetical protein